MSELAQCLGYLTKVFALGRLVRGVHSRRPYPEIPTPPVLLSLLLGVFIRAGSYLDIPKQIKRRRWQHLIHWHRRISDDTLHYVSERFHVWEWLVVLKQERMEVLQEARALSAGQKPACEFHDPARGRQVKLWEVNDLDFSESYGGKVRVVYAEERWVEHKVVGGERISQPQISDWWWMASKGLQGYFCQVIYEGGHRRWGIENKAFNELTQFYHLEHGYHHEPTAMLAQMLILIWGFVLFSAYALLHRQQVRLGLVSLKELAHDLDLALEQEAAWDQWFASG